MKYETKYIKDNEKNLGVYLDFDRTYEEEALINSRPFQDGGINYYVKRKILVLNKWGSYNK